jgi:hypothetical protein
MKTKTIYFYECEHSGDLDHYADDAAKAGASVIDTGLDDDGENGWIRVTTSDWDTFVSAFSDTDSFGFSSLA